MGKTASTLVIIILIPIAAIVAWFWSRPSWQISARNSPQGLVVEVYRSNASQPTYTTVLAGQSVKTEVERVSRTELPLELGQTVFHDETLRPGRWIIMLHDTEIDIMERALIVDDTTEIAPQN